MVSYPLFVSLSLHPLQRGREPRYECIQNSVTAPKFRRPSPHCRRGIKRWAGGCAACGRDLISSSTLESSHCTLHSDCGVSCAPSTEDHTKIQYNNNNIKWEHSRREDILRGERKRVTTPRFTTKWIKATRNDVATTHGVWEGRELISCVKFELRRLCTLHWANDAVSLAAAVTGRVAIVHRVLRRWSNDVECSWRWIVWIGERSRRVIWWWCWWMKTELREYSNTKDEIIICRRRIWGWGRRRRSGWIWNGEEWTTSCWWWMNEWMDKMWKGITQSLEIGGRREVANEVEEVRLEKESDSSVVVSS